MSSSDINVPAPEAIQRRLADDVRAYAGAIDAGQDLPAFVPGEEPTATEVLIAVSRMLDAVDIEVFELGLWNVFGIDPQGGSHDGHG
jgi:hypothetical protein